MNRIGWCDVTWNPVTGCTPVSEACQNCYAKRMAKRLAGRSGYPADDPFRVTLHPDRLYDLLHWRKPRRVFVCSMSDLFHDQVPDEFIWRVFDEMTRGNRRHTYLILTKRPERMREWFRKYSCRFWNYAQGPYVSAPWPDTCIWLGVTVENQARAEERIPVLLDTPAAVRFVSVEPILGEVDLGGWLPTGGLDDDARAHYHLPPSLDWVICGGETGPGARAPHPDWVRGLRDQCVAARVAFWFKGWGGPAHQGWVYNGIVIHGDGLDGRFWYQRPGDI